MNSYEARTNSASMADRAAHNHRGDDEQKKHHETGSSSEGRHGVRANYFVWVHYVLTSVRAVYILLLAE
jgi:hypothetical protein